MDTSSFEAEEGWLEEGLRSTEPTSTWSDPQVPLLNRNLPFVANRDHLSVGELVALF
jgi:hypothetical protein